MREASQLEKWRLEDDKNKTIELLGENVRKLLCFEEKERRSEDVKRLREKRGCRRLNSKERVFLLRRKSERFRNFVQSTLDRYDANMTGELDRMRADLFKFRRSNLKEIREKFEESRVKRKRMETSLETELLVLDERIKESKDSESISRFTLRLEHESNAKIRVEKLLSESNQFREGNRKTDTHIRGSSHKTLSVLSCTSNKCSSYRFQQ